MWVNFILQFNLHYFMEESQSADLQLPAGFAINENISPHTTEFVVRSASITKYYISVLAGNVDCSHKLLVPSINDSHTF
jgi:hypothetical protein